MALSRWLDGCGPSGPSPQCGVAARAALRAAGTTICLAGPDVPVAPALLLRKLGTPTVPPAVRELTWRWLSRESGRLVLVAILLGARVASASPAAYVGNSGSDTVSVLDTAAGTVTATVGVGHGPTGVAVSPSGARAWVTNFGDGTVSVVDTASGVVVATVPVLSLP